MSFSLKIGLMSRICLGVISAFMLSGCLAKNANKLEYYEIGYDESSRNLICDRRADRFVNLAYIKAQSGYDSRDIIIKNGANIILVDGLAPAIKAVSQGRADATMNDKLAILHYLKTTGDKNIKIAFDTGDGTRSVFLFKKS